MHAREYISELIRLLNRCDVGGCKQDKIRIGGREWVFVPNPCFLNIPMNHAFIYVTDGGAVLIDGINKFATEIKIYLNKTYTGLEGWTLKTSIMTLVSELEIPAETKSYVQNNKLLEFWRSTLALPVLVDLAQNDVTTLKHYGFFGGYYTYKNIKLIKEKFTLEGRLSLT